MNFRTLSILLLLTACASGLPAQVITIVQARALPMGSSVTVRGIVTTGAELGKMRYLQDGTAGIAAFPGKGSTEGLRFSLKPGDSIELSGQLSLYHNLLQISPITACLVLMRGQPLPPPRLIRLTEVGPAYESQLVRLESLRFADKKDTISSGTFDVEDDQGLRSKIYFRKGSKLTGAPVPIQPVSLVAIVSRYRDFQLLPLNLQDFVPVPPHNTVHLDTTTVTTALRIRKCRQGKITVRDKAGKEWLFSIVHSSGTTPLDVSQLPPGAYTVLVRTQGQTFTLPFQKV